ncbi:MAG: hypothetical protein OXC99_09130 [Chloroflexi bacterium]|nr:hypothetical protein [Chloroflexota bacterium]
MEGLAKLTPFKIYPAILPQFGIIRSHKGMRHFTRVIPVGSGYPITPLCGERTGQKIKKYQVDGCLFAPFEQKFAIHHVDDFCQGCKVLFRNAFGVRFDRLRTFMIPERYPGCPINEQFALVVNEPRETTDRMREEQTTRTGRPPLYGFLASSSLFGTSSLYQTCSDYVVWECDDTQAAFMQGTPEEIF